MAVGQVRLDAQLTAASFKSAVSDDIVGATFLTRADFAFKFDIQVR